jgi:hypothetical protein
LYCRDIFLNHIPKSAHDQVEKSSQKVISPKWNSWPGGLSEVSDFRFQVMHLKCEYLKSEISLEISDFRFGT